MFFSKFKPFLEIKLRLMSVMIHLYSVTVASPEILWWLCSPSHQIMWPWIDNLRIELVTWKTKQNRYQKAITKIQMNRSQENLISPRNCKRTKSFEFTISINFQLWMILSQDKFCMNWFSWYTSGHISVTIWNFSLKKNLLFFLSQNPIS